MALSSDRQIVVKSAAWQIYEMCVAIKYGVTSAFPNESASKALAKSCVSMVKYFEEARDTEGFYDAYDS